MNYANTIKKLRSRLLLTQSEFANYLGVSFETVNRWENGKNEPTMKIKRKLRELFEENNIPYEEEIQIFSNK